VLNTSQRFVKGWEGATNFPNQTAANQAAPNDTSDVVGPAPNDTSDVIGVPYSFNFVLIILAV